MADQNSIAGWHEKILEKAVQHHASNPEFRFHLRTRGEGGKLSEGYWFQGTQKYLWFGPFGVNDGANKTRTIGFVIRFDRQGQARQSLLAVVLDKLHTDPIKAIHRQIAKDLGLEETKVGQKYERVYSEPDPLDAFDEFLKADYPRIRRIIEDSTEVDSFIHSEHEFESKLARVNKHRGQLRRSADVSWVSASAARDSVNAPINRILYGPPGTGKTHSLRELFERYTERAAQIDTGEWLQKHVAEYGWRPVIVAVMAQFGRPVRVPEVRDHAWTVAKAKERGRDLAGVIQTLWVYLRDHTSDNVTTIAAAVRRPPFIFNRSGDGLWSLVPDWKEQDPDGAKLFEELRRGQASDGTAVHRYRLVTFHPSFSYEDFVRGIRPVVDEETGTTQFRIVDGVFKQICDEARANPGKRYALFIDEINRANISKVFGELITLLEPDKRAVYDENGKVIGGMTVQLPGGSGSDATEEPFGVPANLDVYGTMNTADRSIALLDVALRRRFQFQEMEPSYDKLKPVGEIDVARMLRRINDRLEYLLDRDHRIGHAYLMKASSIEELRTAFELQIIPLLQEYFFDDFGRIALVLGTTRGAPPFVMQERIAQGTMFPGAADVSIPSERVRYTITNPRHWTAASFTGLYGEGIAVVELS